MLRVSLSQVVRTESGDSPELLARFRVDENGIHPEDGERCDEVRTITVLDPETGERVESSEDPLRWARLLPQAIRSGDLVVFVEEDAEETPRRGGSGPMAEIAEELAEAPPAAVH